MAKKTTIFKQLILNVIVPAVLALIVLGVLNYNQTKKIMIESNQTKNRLIYDEIKNILEFQDLALNILEDHIDKQLQNYSKEIVENKLKNTRNIEEVDLDNIRSSLGMDSKNYDIYVINQDGIVINTTFEKDLGLNLLGFGENHKVLISNAFESKQFINERFGIEASTKRLKKYTYQTTLDGKYLIEIGMYSTKADEIIESIQNRLDSLSRKGSGVASVSLFIGEDNPFTLSKKVILDSLEYSLINKVITDKKTYSHLTKSKKQWLEYNYMYMERKNTNLYKVAVIRSISDRSMEKWHLQFELIKFFLIFGITMIIVITMIYSKTRVITDPIKRLVDNVNRITNGHLEERAEVVGNNEITSLSEKFNQMVEKLEAYYRELEDKVRERTAEIVAQKEEIEAQRDELQRINENLQEAYNKIEEQNIHITDSIKYAKRIQNAILPPGSVLRRIMPDSFVFYLPKDIVSGDFYWAMEVDDLLMFAAVDCTGHGVPGAFMSIVGRLHLDFAVSVIGARTSGEVLNALNMEITEFLAQKQSENAIKDGMDVALCVLDKKNKKLQYSGAYNPLFFIRNGELTVYKANRQPVGAFVDENLTQFETHTIDLIDGDIFYIFSDGFADQFGGPDERKYMMKKFREFIFEISDEPMNIQKELIYKEFNSWKGENEQVDDILIIGYKV